MTIARYAVTFGLSGCYIPDSVNAYEVSSRKELADLIRNELEFYEMPKSLFGEVRICRLWSFIARNGSSVAHFHLDHKGNTLGFHGLTADEYAEKSGEV